jgi:CxxC-x17-CxxC domain-containing protein
MLFVRDFNRNRNSGRRDFDKPQIMHQAVCSNCGKTCEVPFKPNGSKPVFCRECFQANRTGDSSRRPSFEDRRPQNNTPILIPQQPNYKEQLDAMNSKLDKIMNLLITAKTVAAPTVVAAPVIAEPVTETPVVKAKKVSKKSASEK